MDPDQLASSEASSSGSTLLLEELIKFSRKSHVHSALFRLNTVDCGKI